MGEGKPYKGEDDVEILKSDKTVGKTCQKFDEQVVVVVFVIVSLV